MTDVLPADWQSMSRLEQVKASIRELKRRYHARVERREKPGRALFDSIRAELTAEGWVTYD